MFLLLSFMGGEAAMETTPRVPQLPFQPTEGLEIHSGLKLSFPVAAAYLKHQQLQLHAANCRTAKAQLGFFSNSNRCFI